MKYLVSVTLLVLVFPLLACGQQTAEQQLDLVISPALLVVMTSALPGGQMGVPYNTTITAMGGVPPYTWAIVLGALPAGLTLGAADGVLGGTPTVTGSFIFTVEATDSAGTAATRKFEFGKKSKKEEKIG
ncbi:hypothetical protein LCGC14_1858540 [marine sediment metagenome]|uniref:Dystroglycan-type cadherin-like domain-containing protein n=1 Tax=marine sediment metagenome TaxID=412755 RepID=A0A0F9IML7_9ZZZZ